MAVTAVAICSCWALTDDLSTCISSLLLLDVDGWEPLDVDGWGSSLSDSPRDLLELAVETSRPVFFLIWVLPEWREPPEDADADDSLPSPPRAESITFVFRCEIYGSKNPQLSNSFWVCGVLWACPGAPLLDSFASVLHTDVRESSYSLRIASHWTSGMYCAPNLIHRSSLLDLGWFG